MLQQNNDINEVNETNEINENNTENYTENNTENNIENTIEDIDPLLSPPYAMSPGIILLVFRRYNSILFFV